MNDEMQLTTTQHSLQYVDPAAVAAAEGAKARIQAMFLMALHKTRNFDQSRAKILDACKRPIFAARVEYSKPVAGRLIRGPSVRFAELALREWGNVMSETQVIYEDAKIRRIRVTLTDLETNSTHSKEIQIGKTVERANAKDRQVVGERLNSEGRKVYIVEATDDELHNKEAAAISKAVRNEGLRLIPSDIIDEAMDTAKETLASRDKEDPAAAKKKVLDSFSEIGIKPKDLEQYLKHKTDTISPAELQDLRGVYMALRSGEATWADYIQPSEVEEKTESKKDALKEKLKAKKEQAPEAPPEESPQDQGTEVVQDAVPGEEVPPSVICPKNNESTFKSFCVAACREREGCPAHE